MGQSIQQGWSVGREVLRAARTYYWRQDGSDSNTGLADSAGGAFLTAQKCIYTIVATLDVAGYTVTVQRGGDAGASNTENITVGAWVGGGAITIDGASRTHAPAAGYSIACSGRMPGDVTLQNMTFTGGGISNGGVGSLVIGTGIVFGACANAPHINVSARGARVAATSNYSITGASGYHINAVHGGFLQCNSKTITITGTPAFSSYWCNADTHAEVELIGNTFSGSATGTRYNVSKGAIINVNGAGTTALPGNAAGSGTNFGASPYGLYN